MFNFFWKSTPKSQTCEAIVQKWAGTYGFLTRGPKTDRIFVHKSNLPKGVSALVEGQRVKVQFISGEKGLAAEKVVIL